MRSVRWNVKGLSIAGWDSGGDGPAIVLCHGNSCSSRSYRHQLESDLGKNFRVIAFDWPGHGESDRAGAPQDVNTLRGYASAIVEITEQLALRGAVYVGWSLGGHVLLEASDALSDAAGFAIFGTPPLALPVSFEKAFLPNPAAGAAFTAEPPEALVDALMTAYFKPGSTVPPLFGEDFRRTDPRARASLAATIPLNQMKDEIDVVRELKKPLAVLHGEHDQLINRRYFDDVKMPTLWRGAVQDIPNTGHAPHWEDPHAFNALIEAFVLECRRR